jgi:hypothetical protein
MGTSWLASDESALISFLVAHKAEAGDGFNFKNTIWKAAALHMMAYTEKGGPKIASACKKNKWAQVHAADVSFLVVLTLIYS